jgi:hydroxymethylpyrimidine pyrophosphatase-like HAD family hydrolase
MQSPTVLTTSEHHSEPERALPTCHLERAFYEQYNWCLNAFPAMADVITHLREELSTLDGVKEGWRHAEVLTNVFLLSCAISDTVDDYLGGPQYDFSQAARLFGPSRLIVTPLNRLVRSLSDIRSARRRRLLRWRDQWESAVIGLTTALALRAEDRDTAPDGWRATLLSLLDYPFPAKLRATRQRIPAAFRSQDLTHLDGLQLGRKLAEDCPDRNRPILVVGLRTAGSYFAPLLRGYLESRGYRNVQTITLRPKRGLGARERSCLAGAAAKGALAAVVDEPVYSASTLARAVEYLRKAGFPADHIRAVFPAHPFRRDWRDGSAGLALSGIRALTLDPEEWAKYRFLESPAALGRIREYLEADGVRTVELPPSPSVSQLRAELEQCEEPGLHWRLKRLYEVGVANGNSSVERRLILAKSVGWGWMGYHAMLAGTRLEPFVPRVLGLRDGILFLEWQPRAEAGAPELPVESAARYLAARACALPLAEDPTRDLTQAGRHRGSEELAGVLSGAYGWKLAAVLKRPRIQHQLARLACPVPTLIDGKMRKSEWVRGPVEFLKTDFEHHGMGKHELNLTDPAYDLAEMILHWELSEDDERRLIRRYIDASGDSSVTGRLFLHKLLAGTWAMNQAVRKLSFPSMWKHRGELNREFLQAWRFLIVHTMRFSAGVCCRLESARWSDPLIILDVDGVLDKQTFGFPSTSAAGIEAVSLLASHGLACALNTARSVSNLKQYCKAYGFVGGVAEYGSFVWDAATGREQILVSQESFAQVEELKNRLREIPGVFLDEDCQFIVRAYTYARGATVPLPETLIRGLILNFKLDRLRLHQTFTDSTVIAAECNKGSGLEALLAAAGRLGWKTVAVGDSEPDLPMFRAATRCFAPSQIGCPGPARQLGCRIATKPYQSGLLEIVRSLVHPKGGSCHNCRLPRPALQPMDKLFMQLLRISDRGPLELLVKSLFDPKALRAFLQ